MGKKEDKAAAAAAAVKASAAKHGDKGNTKVNAKAPAKAPAKAAKPAADKKGGAKGGTGKFHFPVDSAERKALKGKVAQLKKPATTKEVAAKLSVPTWQVRLVAVELVAEKRIKMSKDGSVYTLSPR